MTRVLSPKGSFLVLFLLIVLLNNSVVNAAEFPNPQDAYVNDFAGIFSAGQAGHLRGILQNVRQETTAEVVIVTIDKIEGYDISEYAVRIGQEWGVGKKDNDNGLVILYTLQENRIFAVSGYGLEGILPDSKIGRLLDENYVPLRDSGNVTAGIIKFTEEIVKVLNENAAEIKSGQAESSRNSGFIFILVIIAVFLLIIGVFSYLLNNKRKSRGFSDFLTFFFIDFLVRTIIWSIILRGGGRRSGGSGFGGSSFSGGGFGGGGAGR